MVVPATFRLVCRSQTRIIRSQITSIRNASTAFPRNASPTAPREAPVPLVFANAKGWYENDSKVGMKMFAGLFPELGFNTLEVELDPEIKNGSYPNSLEGILELYAKELRSQINLFHSFPPVLIARGIGTLIAQTYVESYSTSALALIGGQSLIPQQIRPPESHMSIAYPASRNLPTYAPPNFTYEPRFPILSIEAAAKDPEKEVPFREMIHFRGEELDIIKDPGLLDEMAIYHSIRSWLDRVGI